MMKKVLSHIVVCGLLFTACKSNRTDSTATIIEQDMDEIKSSTTTLGKTGKGKITLLCNGKIHEIKGVCGAVTSMGTLTIAVSDDSIPAKTFTINFTNEKMPDATSSYKIVKYNLDDKDANHVTVSYTDMRSALPMNWESDEKSGKLDFTVTGNEIRCSFADLKLQPSMMYNKGEQDAPATVSGELIFYITGAK